MPQTIFWPITSPPSLVAVVTFNSRTQALLQLCTVWLILSTECVKLGSRVGVGQVTYYTVWW